MLCTLKKIRIQISICCPDNSGFMVCFLDSGCPMLPYMVHYTFIIVNRVNLVKDLA